MDDETIFSDAPEEMAIKWYAQGAERIHIVDLDGAIAGRAVNRDVIKRIADIIPVPVELGGGVRDMATLEDYFDLGISYVILGTVAYKNPEFVIEACRTFPAKIIIGIDAKKDRVAVEGWTQDIELTTSELAKRFEGIGASAIIYTDISRDGMKTGPNIDATRALARAVEIPVIASGGISDISDVLNVLTLSKDGVIGMITGRALYEDSLNLESAIRACKIY